MDIQEIRKQLHVLADEQDAVLSREHDDLRNEEMTYAHLSEGDAMRVALRQRRRNFDRRLAESKKLRTAIDGRALTLETLNQMALDNLSDYVGLKSIYKEHDLPETLSDSGEDKDLH